jgi:hypothetical protein
MAHWWSTAATLKVVPEALEGWTGCKSTRRTRWFGRLGRARPVALQREAGDEAAIGDLRVATLHAFPLRFFEQKRYKKMRKR